MNPHSWFDLCLVTANEFFILLDDDASPRLHVAFNHDLYGDDYFSYVVGAAFTNGDLSSILIGWRRHCFTWSNKEKFVVRVGYSF